MYSLQLNAYPTVERYLLRNSELGRALIYGFERFDKLTSVQFGCRWEPVALKRCTKGSPLARSWDPWHCRPNTMFWMNERFALEQPLAGNGTEHYWVLVGALAKSNKKVEELKIGTDMTQGLPVWVFDTQSYGEVKWCNGDRDPCLDKPPKDIQRDLERFVVERGTNPFAVLEKGQSPEKRHAQRQCQNSSSKSR